MVYAEYKKLNKELRKQAILRLMDLPLNEYIELENLSANDFLKKYESENINRVLMESE